MLCTICMKRHRGYNANKIVPVTNIVNSMYLSESSRKDEDCTVNKVHSKYLKLCPSSHLYCRKAVYVYYVFKCYMCTSLTNEGCDYAMSATSSLHPVECTKNNMIHWQRIILQNKQLNPFAKIFDADMPNYTYHQNIPLACAKVILNVENQEKPVTIRTCQTAKTENIDPCKTINQKLKENSLGIMEQCSLCVKDACNDSIVLSSEIIYILATLLGILMHVAFYSWA
ncbi:uncharacterized protein LOC109853786 isoform X3 [Pseudomyrmex gracilis]|nr:uncharacterized protein LOC109853786 isoform X3 [Pseudomyrmex gracilis]